MELGRKYIFPFLIKKRIFFKKILTRSIISHIIYLSEDDEHNEKGRCVDLPFSLILETMNILRFVDKSKGYRAPLWT